MEKLIFLRKTKRNRQPTANQKNQRTASSPRLLIFLIRVAAPLAFRRVVAALLLLGLTVGRLLLLALLDNPMRHPQQPDRRDQDQPPDQVAERRPPERLQPIQIPERCTRHERPEHEQRIEYAVEQLAAGEQRAEENGRDELHAERLRRVLHPGHQRDDCAGKHRQRERTQRDTQLGVVRGGVDGGRLQLGQSGDDQPRDHPAAGQVGHQRDDPQPQQRDDAALSREGGDHRHQEVLGEQLAPGEQQRDEADRERDAGQYLAPGRLLDDEVGEHTGADVDPAQEPDRDQRQGLALEPRLPFVDESVECVLDLRLRLVGRFGSRGTRGHQEDVPGRSHPVPVRGLRSTPRSDVLG